MTPEIRLLAAAILLPHTPRDADGRWDLDAALRYVERLEAAIAARSAPAEATGRHIPDVGAPVGCAPGDSAPLERRDQGCLGTDPAPAPDAPRPRKPRSDRGQPHARRHAGAYDRLTVEERALFDALWRGYGLSHGKQEAAAAWKALQPDLDLARRIVDAARRDAASATDRGLKRPDGTRRKNLQGWLTARRWEDADPGTAQPAAGAQPPDPAAAARAARRELGAEARHLRHTIEELERLSLPVHASLREQLARAEAALAEPPPC